MTTNQDSPGGSTRKAPSETTKRINLSPCLGVAVTYDPALKVIADSRGIGRWKRVFVGPDFLAFPPREQQAILLHEIGHCKLKHLERRILGAWRIFWPPALLRLCVMQELQADLFVRGCGYGPDLARAFSRLRPVPPGHFHPSTQERIARLIS